MRVCRECFSVGTKTDFCILQYLLNERRLNPQEAKNLDAIYKRNNLKIAPSQIKILLEYVAVSSRHAAT